MIEELKGIVDRIEDGSVGLDESIALYEKGNLLIRQCERVLEEAELKVQELSP